MCLPFENPHADYIRRVKRFRMRPYVLYENLLAISADGKRRKNALYSYHQRCAEL